MILKNILAFRKSRTMRSQLDELAEAHEQHLPSLSDEEMKILNNIMLASRMRVDDVMVARPDIKFLYTHMRLPQVIAAVVSSPHTRYPVCEDDQDHVIGFINSKSILWAMNHYDNKNTNNINNTEVLELNGKKLDNLPENFSLRHLVRPVLYVSGNMPAFELLAKMREEKRHLAIVVDEYGGTDGLVTVTDLAEEIIGEMDQDIFTAQKRSVIPIGKNGGKDNGKSIAPIGYLVNPLMRTEDFDKVFATKLEIPVTDLDIDTIGGVVLALAGHVPQKGEKIKTRDGKIIFEVKDSNSRMIKSLLVRGVKIKTEKTPTEKKLRRNFFTKATAKTKKPKPHK